MRYRELRWPCEFPVIVLQGNDRRQATIVNVSAGGARLRIGTAPEPGQIVTLDLGGRLFAATVRWCRAGMCGLRLLTPLGKPELALIRRGRGQTDAVVSGRWNTHLREMR
jgi:hypothetical protein